MGESVSIQLCTSVWTSEIGQPPFHRYAITADVIILTCIYACNSWLCR